MKIFITGGRGFIGLHVLNQALNNGHDVIGLSYSNKKRPIENSKRMVFVQGSLEDDLRFALEGCDALIHLAAYGVDPKEDSWQESFRWNLNATLNICKHAHEVGIKRLIIIGSCFEYGKSAERYEFIPTDAPLEPINAYGASKAAATMAITAYARENNLEVGVLRPFHVYGKGEGPNRFWPSLKKAALTGEDFPMTWGEQIRDFTPVESVAKIILDYATNQKIQAGNPVVKNIGTEKPESLIDFARKNWEIFNAKGVIIPGEIPYRKNEIMRYVPQI